MNTQYIYDKYAQYQDFLARNIPNIVLTYMFWTVLHFVCAHLYVHMCVGYTFWGLITSPLYSSAPHCQALSWTLHTISQKFIAMLPMLATFLMTKSMLSQN